MRPLLIQNVARWLPVLLWMGVIFYFSHQPTSTLPDFSSWNFVVKKSAHLFSYALLGALLQRASGRPGRSWLVAAAYALTDEYHQSFIPGRTPTLLDIGLDWVGAAAGISGWIMLRRLRGGLLGGGRK